MHSRFQLVPGFVLQFLEPAGAWNLQDAGDLCWNLPGMQVSSLL